jgi:hypothetical protein
VIPQLLDDPHWPLVEDTATVGVGVAFLVVGLLHLVLHVAAQAASAEIIIGGVLILRPAAGRGQDAAHQDKGPAERVPRWCGMADRLRLRRRHLRHVAW